MEPLRTDHPYLRDDSGKRLAFMDIGHMVGRFLDPRRNRHNENGVIVEFTDDEHGAFKIVVLSIDFDADIYSQRAPPHFTFVNMVGELPLVRIFLSFIPSVEIFYHTGAAARAKNHTILLIVAIS